MRSCTHGPVHLCYLTVKGILEGLGGDGGDVAKGPEPGEQADEAEEPTRDEQKVSRNQARGHGATRKVIGEHTHRNV